MASPTRPPVGASPSPRDYPNSSSAQQEAPILILDVKLDHPEQITVFENDNPEEIVDSFCTTHNLDSEKKKRLLFVIKQQI